MHKIFKQIKGEIPSEYGIFVSAATAIAIGTAAVSAGVGLYSASKSADAQQDATDANTTLAREQNALAREQFDQTREDNQPWRLAGERALERMSETPDFQFTAEEFDFMADPSYDWRKQEGINALDQSGASRGSLLSGGQQKATMRYGSDLASQEYQNAFNRNQTSNVNRFNQERGEYTTNMNTQKSLAGIGQDANQAVQNAGNSMVNAGQNATNSMINANNANATAQGKAYAGMATAVNTGIENAMIGYNKAN